MRPHIRSLRACGSALPFALNKAPRLRPGKAGSEDSAGKNSLALIEAYDAINLRMLGAWLTTTLEPT